MTKFSRELFKKNTLLRSASNMTNIGIRQFAEETRKPRQNQESIKHAVNSMRMGFLYTFFAKLEHAIDNGKTLLEFLEEQMKHNLIEVQVFEQMELLAAKNTPEPEAKEFVLKFAKHLEENYFKK